MTERKLCTVHKESTPSMVRYETHWHCYGCGAHVPINRLEKRDWPTSWKINQSYNACLNATLKYINSLPSKGIRGFQLPMDNTGYYITYPGERYYVKRMFTPKSNGDKYRSPKGISKPLFKARISIPEDKLFIVEGQLNAKTITTCCFGEQITIVSPGSAVDINNAKYIPFYLQYKSICIIVDEDVAGVTAALKLKAKLLEQGKKVAVYSMPKDMNEIYATQGTKEVEKEVEKALALL